MGGQGSGRLPSTETLVKRNTADEAPVGDGLFLPNYSGVQGAALKTAAPISAGGGTTHDILSATHTDSLAAGVSRGSLITGQGTSSKWTELTIGGAGTVLGSNGTDASWGAAGAGDVTAAVNLTDETLVQGDGGAKGVKTSTATVTQVASAVTHYGDATGADHSDIVTAVGLNTAKDTNVTTNITVVEAPTNVDIQSSDGTNDTIAAADVTNAGVMTTTMYDEHVVNTAHAIDNTQAHTDYLLNNADDTTSGVLTTAGNITTGITSGAIVVLTSGATTTADLTASGAASFRNILVGVEAAPPTASSFPQGTLWFKYTA